MVPAAPPAPWTSDIDALLWWHPATEAGRRALPPELAGRAGLPVALGGLIAYRSGPVGPYGEVFGAPVMLRGGPALTHVPFMAVDSSASVAGGRGNWALPKELARFDGVLGRPGTVTARGQGWALRVATRARPRRVPVWAAFSCAQVWPDGSVRSFRVTVAGSVRLASAEVAHPAGSPLAGWLVPGRHPAVLVSGRQRVGPPS
jgi:hypothetical protein